MGKFINATNNSVSSYLLLNVSYSPSDASGIVESSLNITKYNASGWNTNPSTFSNKHGVDTTNHYVYANITKFNGIFAPMGTPYQAPNCLLITASGTYAMANNFTGAPNNASEISSPSNACVKIASSNVVFDCQGYNITNNGTTGTTYGILLNGSLTNVTVRNCPVISNYTYGVYAYQSNNSVFTNDSAYNGSIGFNIVISYNNTIANDYVSGSGTGMSIGAGPSTSLPNYLLNTDTYASGGSTETHTFSYNVNSPGTFVVLMISGGYDDISSVSLPSGCAQQKLVNGADGFESSYIATCTQNTGPYNVGVTIGRI